jgi:hypothetical protein
VGIPSASQAQQLAHPRVQTLLKRIVKRALGEALGVEFVVMEAVT